MEAVHLLGSQNRLGEGPLWSEEEQKLYWVDIKGKIINRYSPEEDQHQIFPVNAQVGVIAFREIGGFIAAGSTGFSFWDIGQEKLELIRDPESHKSDSRFNDGKVDRKGRFWAGTMTAEGAVSSLYRMDADLSLHTMETGITISNGIGWSPDNRTMYYSDSLRYVIYAYDYDLVTGGISNRRDFIRVEPEFGIPDGLTVDSQGSIWCAFYSGAKVARFDSQGNLTAEVPLPVTQPTSCIFGGKDFTDLYITSAWDGLSSAERQAQPQAGDLFFVQTGVKGLPEPAFVG